LKGSTRLAVKIAIAGAAAKLAALAGLLPAEFGWLATFLQHVAAALGKTG
jgi:hypothetical protein